MTKVVLTHEHYDHAGGSDVFPQAEVICQRACQEMFKLDVIGMAPKQVHQTFDDRLSIDLGSHQVDLYHVAPGDGRAATLIHLPKENIVASADMYTPRGFTNSAFIQDSTEPPQKFGETHRAESDLCHQWTLAWQQCGGIEGKCANARRFV